MLETLGCNVNFEYFQQLILHVLKKTSKRLSLKNQAEAEFGRFSLGGSRCIVAF